MDLDQHSVLYDGDECSISKLDFWPGIAAIGLSKLLAHRRDESVYPQAPQDLSNAHQLSTRTRA